MCLVCHSEAKRNEGFYLCYFSFIRTENILTYTSDCFLYFVIYYKLRDWRKLHNKDHHKGKYFK
jgi:hypothetical protein